MPSLVEVVFIRVAVERILDIDIETVHRIDQFDQRIEVDSYEVGDIYAVELFQSPHGGVDTVNSGVREFISLAVGDLRDRHIVISGCGCQKNPLSLGIHRDNDIDITSAGLGNISVDVNAADHDVERFTALDGFFLNACLDPVFMEDLDLVLIIVIFQGLRNDGRIRFVVDRPVHLAVHHGFGGFYVTAVILDLDLGREHVLYLIDHRRSAVILSGCPVDRECIILCVAEGSGRIVGPDDHDHIICLQRFFTALEQIHGPVKVVIEDQDCDDDHTADRSTCDPDLPVSFEVHCQRHCRQCCQDKEYHHYVLPGKHS